MRSCFRAQEPTHQPPPGKRSGCGSHRPVTAPRRPESQRPEDPRVLPRFLGRCRQEPSRVLLRPEAATPERSSLGSALPFKCPASCRWDRKANLRAPPNRNGRGRHGMPGGRETGTGGCQRGKVCAAGRRLAANGRSLGRDQSLRRQKTSAPPKKARTQEQRSGLERGPRRRGWRQAQDGGRGRCSEDVVSPAAPRGFLRRSPGRPWLPFPAPLLGILGLAYPSHAVSPGQSSAGQVGVSVVRYMFR